MPMAIKLFCQFRIDTVCWSAMFNVVANPEHAYIKTKSVMKQTNKTKNMTLAEVINK